MFPFRCSARYPLPVTLSVVIITYNEEANIGRALESVMPLLSGGQGEIIVVDSGSTDRTVDIAKSFGAKVYVEEWKGYAAQKNSGIDKATGDWILSLDADEEADAELIRELPACYATGESMAKRESREWCVTGEGARKAYGNFDIPKGRAVGFSIQRKNFFLGRWIQHGGFWPDPKLRLFHRGDGRVEERSVHETIQASGRVVGIERGALIHHCYPTLSDYIDHMNRYSSLGAEMAVANRPRSFSVIDILLRPVATFIYNYFFRLGFLDGREGLLLHLYHAVYVSWKYAKAWELSQSKKTLRA
jgi:glycosyltransferase involved in cell wall biosynthesis